MFNIFKLKEYGTNVKTELIAGSTTFLTMAYIIFVNPSILALTGMSSGGVFVATILAAVIGTLVMAFVANVPYALAPGMGLNAFFTFTVCFAMGFAWQEALALVFICGIINIIITVTSIRKKIIKSIPRFIQSAIGGGIGLFIAYIGIKGMGLLTYTSDPGTYIDASGTIISQGSSIVPALAVFANPGVQLALIGLLITIVLVSLKVKGSILISIIATTIIGIPMGVTDLSGLQNGIFSISNIGAIKDTAFAFFGSPGIGSLFTNMDKVFLTIITIFAFSLSDTFDTIGTFLGTGKVSKLFDDEDEKKLFESKGFKSRMDKALFADATATSIGALLGTSNTTTYVESSAGITAGGRTGLTSLTVAILFLLCLPFSPLFAIVPGAATAPVLVAVGIFMMGSFADIKWSDFTEAAPAFMTFAVMAFAYSITYGIAAGFITYCIIKLLSRKWKEVHPIIYGATILFIINFVVMAIRRWLNERRTDKGTEKMSAAKCRHFLRPLVCSSFKTANLLFQICPSTSHNLTEPLPALLSFSLLF
ncbi:MAG: NCS2 family permease [Firmicutes bacterium]|nr:NCS2 family permease [Bacillota bacterium]